MEAEQYLRYAKETLAGIMKVQTKEILFTSGGTEANNMALIGCAMAARRQGNHLITTQVEHPAVLQPMQYLESQGFQVTYLPVDAWGRISLQDLEAAIRPKIFLQLIQPPRILIQMGVYQLCRLGHTRDTGHVLRAGTHIFLLAAAVYDGLELYPLPHIEESHALGAVDLMTAGRQQIDLHPPGQYPEFSKPLHRVHMEKDRGVSKAAELVYAHLDEDTRRLYELKEYFAEQIGKVEGVRINGIPSEGCRVTAPHVVSVSFAGVRSEVMLHALEEKGIYVSAGSACASNKPQTSATLKAMKLPRELWDSTIRFSFSVYTTREEIDYTLHTMYDMIPMLRKYTRR